MNDVLGVRRAAADGAGIGTRHVAGSSSARIMAQSEF